MKPSDFINIIAPLAVSEQKRTGVLSSITIAQAIIESGWGESVPGNNLFGIKGTGQELVTKEYINGSFVTVKDGFRVYADWEGSVRDHSDFLRVNARYANAGFFDCCVNLDYAGAAKALQAAGYATDPLYNVKLRGVINQYKLYDYDKIKEGEPMLEKWEADTIINTWISPAWKRAEADRREASAAGQDQAAQAYEEVKSNCHELANALRRASGQPEE